MRRDPVVIIVVAMVVSVMLIAGVYKSRRSGDQITSAPSLKGQLAPAAAAEEGMKATIPLVARKGRASYLGERSAGHQDPGATSSWLLMRTAAETFGDHED